MKKIQSTLVARALVAATSAVANAQSTAAPQPGARSERVRSDSTHKRGRSGHARGMKGGEMRGAFRGLNLTDAQKTQLKAIHQKYQPQAKPLIESMRPAMQNARAARQRGDTAAARTAFAGTADARAKLQVLRTQERNEIRAILTPEQQKTFDANAASRKEHGAGRGKWAKKG